MGLHLLDYQPNFLFYRFYFLKNLIVPESENAKTSRLQFLSSILIIPCLVSVLPPIHLNDEPLLKTDKIQDVVTKWMLTAKFQTRNLATSQEMPQSLFRVGHVVAQRSLQLPRTYFVVCLADHNLPHPLPRLPLKGRVA